MPCQPGAAQKLGGRPAGIPPGALKSRQPACKPGSGWHAGGARIRDGHSSGTPVTRRLQQPTRTAGSGHDPEASCARALNASRRPYSVLLPVGFAVPPALPPARCALTAPFHPCRGLLRNAPRRSVLCGTVPGLAPAGRYPAPFDHGARTFLPGAPSHTLPRKRGREGWGPERPSGRLTGQGWGRGPAPSRANPTRRRRPGDRS
jgi:hypothetical protein